MFCEMMNSGILVHAARRMHPLRYAHPGYPSACAGSLLLVRGIGVDQTLVWVVIPPTEA